MASIDEIGHSPIQYAIQEIIHTLSPKKEYAGRSSDTFGGVSTSRIQDQIDFANSKLGKTPAFNANDFFLNGSSSASNSAWSAIYSDRSKTALSVVEASGRSPSQMAELLGFDVDVDWPRYRNMTMDEMMLDLEAKYPRPSTTTTTTTTKTTSTTTTTSTSKSGREDLMGDTQPGKDDGATPEERAALAKKAADEIIEKAGTPDGEAAWKKLAKRMRNNPLKTASAIGGIALIAAVTAITTKALNSFLASDGAEIDFTSIKTRSGLINFLVDPTEVDCQWKGRKVGPKAGPLTSLSTIRVLEGDSVIFYEAQLPKVQAHEDGVVPTIVTDVKKQFSVDTETGDSSGIDYKNKGWGKIAKTSFSAHFANEVNDLLNDVGTVLTKAAKQFFPDFNSVLNTIIMVLVIIIGMVAIGAIVSALSSSTSNTS